ncbi:hypothetical protein PENTCL1PPCAC_9670, partial [Pristionchus entomophagus]
RQFLLPPDCSLHPECSAVQTERGTFYSRGEGDTQRVLKNASPASMDRAGMILGGAAYLCATFYVEQDKKRAAHRMHVHSCENRDDAEALLDPAVLP